MKPLLTTENVAELLKIKPQTIRLWACRKKIPSYKVFGCLRFKAKDIDALINSNASMSYQVKIDKILLKI
jgi:excisionase family DNA binding protein